MGKAARYAIGAVLIVVLGMQLLNASWLADAPTGTIKLVAAKAADLPRDDQGCITTGNVNWGQAPVGHATSMLQMAAGQGADGIVIDSALVNGVPVLPDYFPSRCAADKAAPRSPAAEAMQNISRPDQFIRVTDAAHAAAILAATPDGGPPRIYFGAKEADIAAIKGKPAFSVEKARACAGDYRLSGLWGSVPESCKGGTMLLTLDDLGMTLWGWPNRFMARMQAANMRLIVAADVEGGTITGLSELSQYNDIASSYRGYIWIDNIEDLGPALKR
jgi:hypothetical protein